RAQAAGRKTPQGLDKPAPASPAAVAQNTAKSTPATATSPKQQPSLINVSGTTQAPNRLAAIRLIAEARDLERRGLYIEARQKALEADALGVAFAIDEDSPRSVLLSLASKTDQRVKQLLAQAHETLNMATDPARFEKAAAHIAAAQQLTMVFGLDPRPIEIQIQAVRQAASKANVISPIAAQGVHSPALATAGLELPPNPPAAGNRQLGLEKLDKARLEIQAGNYPLARRLAEDAFNPAYGVQAEAAAVLRTIDAEEHLHQTVVAKRNYEAGLEAFHRRDFARAAQLWQAVDMRLLPLDKQRQLAELMQDLRTGSGIVLASAKVDVTSPGAAPGAATATDRPANDVFAQHLALEEIQVQKLRERGLAALNGAMMLVNDKKHAQAVDTLKAFLDELKNASVNQDNPKVVALRRQVEAKAQQYATLQAQMEMQARVAQLNKNPEALRQENIAKLQQEVAALMKEARAKYKEGRFEQALAEAKKAKALDADNIAADAMITLCNRELTLREDARQKAEFEEFFLKALDRGSRPYVDENTPLKFDKEIHARASKRKAEPISWQLKDPVERDIQRKLELPHSFYWDNTPLSQVIEDISKIANMNVHADVLALKKENISLDMPMTLKVENIKLRSALNTLLAQAKLTYVIKDQMLQITTESEAKGKTKQVIHPVADLIVPVENHQAPEITSLNAALLRHIHKNGNMTYGAGPTPFIPPYSLPNNTGVPVSSMKDAPTALPSSTGFVPNPNTKLMPGQTMEDLLINLIKSTVAQNTWSDVGGQGAIQYYPLGMALVVNQTLEVQEEVAALLQSLRRLQDLEIAIEMRLVSVSEAFFERMALDFDINIRTPHSRYESQLLSGQFAPFGSINRNLGVNGVISGLTPAGTLTPDLNVPIKSSSYNFTIPPFGGYPGTIGSDGGLSLGLAFLNDIQVFMLLEAAQGDRRTNVMQAPKITVFNGQLATMNIQDFQFFLTDVQIAVPGNGNQLFFVPNQAPYPLGISMTVLPVVSADRRFVRINLAPNLANLASATVPLFPVSIV
ncbi:MAG: type II and III secretion system protein, partial [Gemmataceae bacterium]|nr:type II and III secretion system protein [Gemmataceae bacterium]